MKKWKGKSSSLLSGACASCLQHVATKTKTSLDQTQSFWKIQFTNLSRELRRRVPTVRSCKSLKIIVKTHYNSIIGIFLTGFSSSCVNADVNAKLCTAELLRLLNGNPLSCLPEVAARCLTEWIRSLRYHDANHVSIIRSLLECAAKSGLTTKVISIRFFLSLNQVLFGRL